jgi:hypothetical protein
MSQRETFYRPLNEEYKKMYQPQVYSILKSADDAVGGDTPSLRAMRMMIVRAYLQQDAMVYRFQSLQKMMRLNPRGARLELQNNQNIHLFSVNIFTTKDGSGENVRKLTFKNLARGNIYAAFILGDQSNYSDFYISSFVSALPRNQAHLRFPVQDLIEEPICADFSLNPDGTPYRSSIRLM